MPIFFEPQQTIESTKRAGVTFTVRNLNKFQRAKRDAALVDARFRVSKLWAQRAEHFDANDKILPGHELEWARIDTEAGLVMVGEIQPAYIRAGLVSIEGYSIAGVPATVETLLAEGEDDLIDEIHAACFAGSGLTVEQEKNSPSLGTSPVAADGQATPTTAPAASV